MRRRVLWTTGFAVVLLGAMTAVALAQSTTWVSTGPNGSGGDGPVAVSDDGRFVAFVSSTALVSSDRNDLQDVYVRDMQTGQLELISVSSSGAQGNQVSGSTTVDISGDGRHVLFSSAASNLAPGVTGAEGIHSKLFVRDRQAGTTTLITRDDGVSPATTSWGAISGNGRYVVLSGPAYLVDQPTGVFVWDVQTEEIIDRLDAGPFAAHYEGMSVDMSDDGRHVAFITSLLDDQRNVIWYDRDTGDWQKANPTPGDAPLAPTGLLNRLGGWISISGDGRHVAFASSHTNMVGGGTSGALDVYAFDSQTENLQRIAADGHHNAGQFHPNPVLSADGRYVAFSSGNPSWVTGEYDIVVYDRTAGTAQSVTPFDTIGRQDAGRAYQPAISRDGRYVAMRTDGGFQAGDTGGFDVYIVDREGTPGDGGCTHDFTDLGTNNIFESDICWLANEGITRGCNPPTNTRFCPSDYVTRGQMAAFLVRALGLTASGDGFTDTTGHVFAGDVARLAEAGITRGCNPPTNTRFCPDEPVTRGQMAAFLVRALDLTATGDTFDDSRGHLFEGDIRRLAEAGITRGCNPPSNTRFCPDDNVTREQMAAFLRRALG